MRSNWRAPTSRVLLHRPSLTVRSWPRLQSTTQNKGRFSRPRLRPRHSCGVTLRPAPQCGGSMWRSPTARPGFRRIGGGADAHRRNRPALCFRNQRTAQADTPASRCANLETGRGNLGRRSSDTRREHPATVTITGFQDEQLDHPVSRGAVAIQTSQDPVGAPIFYRDVPLMPSELKKGVIKPLAQGALPLIAWRLRNIAEPRSRLLLTGMHTCANCHSFSRDGKTLGMDLDGPENDKGLYALASVQPQMSIRNQDVITWSSFRDEHGFTLRESVSCRRSRRTASTW